MWGKATEENVDEDVPGQQSPPTTENVPLLQSYKTDTEVYKWQTKLLINLNIIEITRIAKQIHGFVFAQANPVTPIAISKVGTHAFRV